MKITHLPLASILLCAAAVAYGEQAGVAPSTDPVPPIAAKKPYQVPSPFGTREDDYYWLRDDSRQSVEVLNYLDSENAYRDVAMASTNALQQKLYNEIIGRLKPDDASVPVYKHGYWYYTRFEPGLDYPIYARRKGSLSAPEQVMLEGNGMAKGHEYFRIGATAISPDGKLLAYTEDVVGRRQYTLKIKNLSAGTILADAVINVEPEVVWAADNKTLLYIEKDPVTLLSVRVHKHKLGTDPAKDSLVYEEKDHSYYMGIGRSRSEKYLYIELQSTEQSEWRYAEATDPSLHFQTVLPREPKLKYEVENIPGTT
jgi:oligopeptidase B